MNKIIEGAKEALKIAQCDHELILTPTLATSLKMDRFYCNKCHATIWKPCRIMRVQA